MKSLIANLGLMVFGIFAAFLYLRPTPQLNETNTRVIRGMLGAAREIDRLKGTDTLELELIGHTLPYRASGFRAWFPPHAFEQISETREIVIRVLPEELEKPSRDRLERRSFIPIYSLDADGTTIASLDRYNAWRVREGKIGKWVTLMLCAGCVILLFRRITNREKLSQYRNLEVSVAMLSKLEGRYVDSFIGQMKTRLWACILIIGTPILSLFVVFQDGFPKTFGADAIPALIIPFASIALGAFILHFSCCTYLINDRGVSRVRRKKVIWSIDFQDVTTAVLRVDHYENATIELKDTDGNIKPVYVYPSLAARLLSGPDTFI